MSPPGWPARGRFIRARAHDGDRGTTCRRTETYCWRFRVDPSPMTLDDRVVGTINLDAASLGDFPVTRKAGEIAYQLAVVVDDADAGVGDIVRGDDLLASTFRQMQIIAALREADWQPQRPWQALAYAHVPLVVGPDGRRLAKRHGDTRLSWFREAGVSPTADRRLGGGNVFARPSGERSRRAPSASDRAI